jgi:hypothetical protein
MKRVGIPATGGRQRVPASVLAMMAVAVLSSAGCSIDKSIRVDSAARNKSYRLIDGNLDVERGQEIRSARVIDGNLYLHEDSVVSGSVQVIDGDVLMRSGSRIGGGLEVIDGSLDAEEGSVIGGDLELQHGTLDLRGLTIEGDVEIYCSGGNLFSTRVEGVFRIRREVLWHSECASGRNVTIHPGSEIRKLVMETEDVTVRLEEGAVVHETVRSED